LALTDNTRESIKSYLVKVVSKYVKESLLDTRQKPFHARLMPLLGNVRFSERSFSTRTGSWFQTVARIAASQYHTVASNSYLVKGQIQPAAEAHIKTLVESMDHGSPRRIPNRDKDIAEVLTVQSSGGTLREVRSDLFIRKHDGDELYFEMKTPDPNKGQCKKMKEDILTISALRHQARAQAYAAAAYNPFGDGAAFEHNYARQFLEIGKDFIVGRPFWTLIGEPSTYDELLQIAEDVGREIQPIIDARLP
jgi:hypothetical protein